MQRFGLFIIAFCCWAGQYFPVAAQVTVSVRGDYDADDIRKRVEFYTYHFGIEDRLYIHILFTHRMREDQFGYVQFADDSEQLGVKHALIKINKKASRAEQLIALAHEMVHVQQFVTGKLCKHNDFHYTWKKQSYEDIRKIAYHKRAWEAEAIKLEVELFRLYETSHTPVVLSNAYP